MPVNILQGLLCLPICLCFSIRVNQGSSTRLLKGTPCSYLKHVRTLLPLRYISPLLGIITVFSRSPFQDFWFLWKSDCRINCILSALRNVSSQAVSFCVQQDILYPLLMPLLRRKALPCLLNTADTDSEPFVRPSALLFRQEALF